MFAFECIKISMSKLELLTSLFQIYAQFLCPINQNQNLGDILDSFPSISLHSAGLNSKGEIT